jgi:hypothetical protein
LGEDEEYQQFKKQSSSIYEQIKSKEGSGVVEAQDEDVGKITASVQSSKLKDMLAGLKSE